MNLLMASWLKIEKSAVGGRWVFALLVFADHRILLRDSRVAIAFLCLTFDTSSCQGELFCGVLQLSLTVSSLRLVLFALSAVDPIRRLHIPSPTQSRSYDERGRAIQGMSFSTNIPSMMTEFLIYPNSPPLAAPSVNSNPSKILVCASSPIESPLR